MKKRRRSKAGADAVKVEFERFWCGGVGGGVSQSVDLKLLALLAHYSSVALWCGSCVETKKVAA